MVETNWRRQGLLSHTGQGLETCQHIKDQGNADFEACIVSKVLYGLETVWLLKDQLRKLDASFYSCLRKIAGVLPSFLSRIPNTAILAQLRAIPLSQTLHKRQLMLYGKLVQKPDADFTRRVAIEPGDCRPRDWKPKRRVGRPCLRWAESVYAMGLKSFGGNVLDFHGHLNTPGPFHWRSVVSQLHCLGS